MQNIIPELQKHFRAVIDQLKEDLKGIRTGQANPALLENLVVEAYGAPMRLLELATITNDGPSTLIIAPFDASVRQDVEKAILKSPLGLSPRVQGNSIIVTIPALSEEQRGKYIKIVADEVEAKKHIVRGYRDDARKKVKHAFEAKEIGEDEKFRVEKDIDDLTHKINEEIQTIRDHKEKEIKTV